MYKIFQQHGTVITDVGPPYQTSGENGRARLRRSRYDENGNYVLGENDLSLAVRLRRAGSDHRKFLRQVFVSADITAPLYWWKEFDTYKVSTVANSTSTMHKLHAGPITAADFSCERMRPETRRAFDAVVELSLIHI